MRRYDRGRFAAGIVTLKRRGHDMPSQKKPVKAKKSSVKVRDLAPKKDLKGGVRKAGKDQQDY
jgi:hypothetical protein